MKSWAEYLRLLVFMPLGCAVASVAATYDPAPFSNYQPILDRMPFGAPPPAVLVPDIDPELLKTAEQEKAEQQQIARQLSFSALNITPKGTTAVGFTDRGVNPPRSFYLEVGASADGWTVLAADYNKDWARFEKDDVIITMHLDKGLIDDPSSTNSISAVASTDGAAPSASEAVPPPPASSMGRRSIRHADTASDRVTPGLVRRPSPRVSPTMTPAGEDENPQAQPASFLERRRATVAQEQAKEQAVRTAAEQANNEKLQELARKIARDELNKREQEQSETFDRLLQEQELFKTQQREAEEREAAEAEQPEPEAEEQE